MCTVELNGKAVGRYEGMKMKTKNANQVELRKNDMKMKIKMIMDMEIKKEMKTDGWNIV